MFRDTELFRNAADNIYAITPSGCQIDMKPELARRSYAWYGQPARTYNKAIDHLYVMPNITALELKPVKIKRDRTVYLVKDGKSHMFNDINAFMREGGKYGFDDFNQVILLRENEFNFIPKGETIF